MQVKYKYNDEKENLFCVFCKERIEIGEKYAIVKEECLGEYLTKEYHTSCIPDEEDDE